MLVSVHDNAPSTINLQKLVSAQCAFLSDSTHVSWTKTKLNLNKLEVCTWHDRQYLETEFTSFHSGRWIFKLEAASTQGKEDIMQIVNPKVGNDHRECSISMNSTVRAYRLQNWKKNLQPNYILYLEQSEFNFCRMQSFSTNWRICAGLWLNES